MRALDCFPWRMASARGAKLGHAAPLFALLQTAPPHAFRHSGRSEESLFAWTSLRFFSSACFFERRRRATYLAQRVSAGRVVGKPRAPEARHVVLELADY